MGNGGLTEKIAIHESRCLPIPELLSYAAAASFMVNYCTAFHGLTIAETCRMAKPF